jgi:hypothetical protein
MTCQRLRGAGPRNRCLQSRAFRTDAFSRDCYPALSRAKTAWHAFASRARNASLLPARFRTVAVGPLPVAGWDVTLTDAPGVAERNRLRMNSAALSGETCPSVALLSTDPNDHTETPAAPNRGTQALRNPGIPSNDGTYRNRGTPHRNPGTTSRAAASQPLPRTTARAFRAAVPFRRRPRTSRRPFRCTSRRPHGPRACSGCRS